MSGLSALRQPPAAPDAAGVVGDRYRLERVLGKGGMGEVLAVLEPATGERFALKRLLPGAKQRSAMLLQREFHTLSSLKHPHIVRAFDFGSDSGAPYYTMELLAGSDVESLAPMPWTEVVPILRDLASALSLIHARHLVHRDVGARNVWRTPEGTVKLIDFGALTSFGASSDLSGTPPYVAPEALRTHVLDQRTDLYSLGALAYFLITGRHAYAARSLSELEQRWADGFVATSTRLAELARADLPALPEELEQLIEALLAAAPHARPASAAEVLDRLDDVLPGSAAVAKVALEGVLASKVFVGRGVERKRLRALLKRTQIKSGATVTLLGPRGIGRTRLLSELAVEARVAGAHVIQVAGDGERSALSAATRATLKLLETLPSIARSRAAPYASVLGHLSEEMRSALGIAAEALERFPALQGEARVRMQSALRSYWLHIASDQPVVLLLDDLQNMDESSLALFTVLGRDAAQSELLVVAGVRADEGTAVPAPAQVFVDKATVLMLGALGEDDCREMLRSIFGDAEHLARTAQHLADKAEGNPGRLMELCEYLVRNETIRCSEGVWVLPQELTELVAPASLAQLDEARLSRAGEDARALARALSVMQGAVPLELCSALSPLTPSRLFPALDELCARGVLVQHENGYAFRSEALREGLVARLDPVAAEHAHTTAGKALLAFEQPSLVQRLSAGVHFMRGGSVSHGAEVVYRALVDVVRDRPEEHGEIAMLIEQSFGYVRKLPLTDHERLAFLCMLAWGGYFVDRRLGFSYGDEAMACAQRVCGMDLARRLSPWLGRKLGLYVALISASIALKRRAKHSRLVPDLRLALLLLNTAAGCLAGMYALCIARDKVLESARALEPLSALGPDHASSVVYQFVMGCADAISDHPGAARDRWLKLMARLDDPRPIKELDSNTRDYYTAASMYVWGSTDCWRDKSRTIEIADRLEQQPLKLYQLSADQLRAQYYANQGDVRAAAHHKAGVELRALQRGMTWQVEIWSPCGAVSVATRQRDALALKRAAGQLRHLSASAPSLCDYVDYARASYLLLRSRPGEALAVLEPLLERRTPNLIGNANLVGLQAQAYNALDRFADAERVASQAVLQLHPEDLDFQGLTLRLQIELALAQAGLGRHEQAAAALDALLARYTPAEGPLTLGALHDARASVALRAEQETIAQQHIEVMQRWYRSTDCPGLIQHCDRIARRWAKDRAQRGEGAVMPNMSFLATISSRFTSTGQKQPSEELVAELVRAAAASEGVLVYTGKDGQRNVVRSRTDALPEGLETWIEERMSSALGYRTETEDSEENSAADPNLVAFEGKAWRLFLLVTDHGPSDTVIGAVALCSPSSQVPLDVLRSLAHYLRADSKHTSSSEWSEQLNSTRQD